LISRIRLSSRSAIDKIKKRVHFLAEGKTWLDDNAKLVVQNVNQSKRYLFFSSDVINWSKDNN